MVNGTIAFDTLQTSGQITSTAKSLDTDYIVSGSAKVWCNHTSGAVINDSLNTSSVTDQATGSHDTNITNAMSNALYSCYCGAFGTSGKNFGTVRTASASVYRSNIYDDGGTATDRTVVNSVQGDLA